MKNALNELRENLAWFVDQSEHVTLVLAATDAEVAYALKMLDMVEGPRSSDLFLSFAHSIVDANGYTAEVMNSLRLQIAAVNEERKKQEGLEPWPELPAACDDLRIAPSMRIRHMLEYVRERIPETSNTIVLTLLPFSFEGVEAREAYSSVVQSLLPWDGAQAWMEGVRVILRDDRDELLLIPRLLEAEVDHVVYYDNLDLSHEGLCAALAESATSVETSGHDRMMATVQLASLDLAYKRYGEAYAKWGLVYDFYDEPEPPLSQGEAPLSPEGQQSQGGAQAARTMRALALNGAGDVLQHMGKVSDAKEKYQSGLALCEGENQLTVSLNLLLGASDCCIHLEQWEEAEGYLNLASQVATVLHQLWAKCDILDKLGVAMVSVGKNADAMVQWRACADLSCELKYYERAESAQEHLSAMYGAAQMPLEQQQAETELARIKDEHAAFAGQGTNVAGTHAGGSAGA